MKIAIMGAGNVGATLARSWAASGHEILISFSRDGEKLRSLAAEVGGTAGPPAEIAAEADVIVLAVPYGSIDLVHGALGRLDGRVVIDATNPIGLAVVGSAAEEIAARTGAHVVKAFNTVFASVMAQAPTRHGLATMLYAGDDLPAKQVVATLVRDAGFDPIDAGVLERARELEAYARLVIGIAMGGRGPFAYRFAPLDEL